MSREAIQSADPNRGLFPISAAVGEEVRRLEGEIRPERRGRIERAEGVLDETQLGTRRGERVMSLWPNRKSTAHLDDERYHDFREALIDAENKRCPVRESFSEKLS